MYCAKKTLNNLIASLLSVYLETYHPCTEASGPRSAPAIHLANNGSGILISDPGFDYPYPRNSNCKWRLYAPRGTGKVIQLDVKEWDVSGVFAGKF